MLCRSASSEANHSARRAEAAQFERQRNMPAEARAQAIAQGARRTPPGRSAPRYARAKQCSSQLCHRQAPPCLAIAGLCQPSPLLCPSGRCASQLSRCQSSQTVALPIRPLRINPYAPHICAHANRLSDRPICSVASLFPSRQIPAVQRLAAASQSIALVAIQCPRVAYPRKADPICALANLGIADPLPFSPLQCLRHLLPINPWRFRRYPILVAHCLSVARAKQGDALPPQFRSVHLVRITAHRGHPLRCLCSAKLFAAAAMPGNAFPSQIQPFLCRCNRRLSSDLPGNAFPTRIHPFLCHSQLSPCTPPRINGNRRLSRALPG